MNTAQRRLRRSATQWRQWIHTLTAGIAVTTACAGADPTGSTTLQVTFSPGITRSDTVNALPLDTVVVTVQDSRGHTAPGVVVEFDSPGDELHHVPQVFIETLAGHGGITVTDTTDTVGRAGVLVYRGITAGTAWLRARTPASGMIDSLAFQIVPGNAAKIKMVPADTALLVGSTLIVAAHVTDRFDNVRPDAVTVAAESSAVSANGTGSTAVTAVAVGRASVRATGAGQTVRSWISVVPAGTIAFYVRAFSTGDSIAIATASTDGSHYTSLWSSLFDYTGSRPLTWAPDAQSLVFPLESNQAQSRLYRITMNGTILRLIQQDPPGNYPQVLPRYGPNGWIYYTAQTDWSNGTDELWRVHEDGTSPARIGLPAAPYQSDTYAAPAPDGVHVWFATDRPGPGTVDPVTLGVLRADSGTVTYLNYYGIGAAWSPVGDRVAFIDHVGAILVAAPDGSGRRVVSQGARMYEPYINWSPDGKWIVASGPTGVDLIDPDHGVTLPLAFAARWRHPAWRP